MADRQNNLTRRQVLVGAGAASVSLGAVALSSSQAQAAGKWDQEADIVVVGSGAGASTAAIIAHDNGDSVTVLEKAPIPGGTSAKSAGVLWIPNNFALRARNIDDKREDCIRFMARFSYPERFNPTQPQLGIGALALSMLEAFYDNASPAIERLRKIGALEVAEWRMFALDKPATDYLDHVQENKVPAGRTLGPLKPDGKTVGLGADLMVHLNGALRKRNIPLLLGHRVVRLVINGAGRVVGVEAEAAGKTVTVRARKAVIFGTGGYAHNPEFVATYQRVPIYGACAQPWSTGDFINIAGAIGARLGYMAGAWRTQILLEEALQNPNLAAGVFFPPGDSMLQVNRYGKRVVDENRNYNDRTEVHAQFNPTEAEYPNHLMFMIYDQRTAEGFAGAYPLPDKPTGAPYVISAETLEALTTKLSERLKEVGPKTGGFTLASDFSANLKASIARFNGFSNSGKDDDFGRGKHAYDTEWHAVFSPMHAGTKWPANPGPNRTMHPLAAKGPYYVIILASGALDTNGGPMIDSKGRVLNTKDEPIPGLYGAGNCIASPSRYAYWGAGHTLGSAITWGAIAANSAHLETPSTAE
jgi:succinate dehydrogenase/fumarate reductase flavoprotein subunit